MHLVPELRELTEQQALLLRGMPTPVSCTSMMTDVRPSTTDGCSRSTSTRTVISPLNVNLIAFETRLLTICRMRAESPFTCSGTLSSMRTLSARPF